MYKIKCVSEVNIILTLRMSNKKTKLKITGSGTQTYNKIRKQN